MAKLYPPFIEGTIPAFFEDENGTVTLTVPFSMNKMVGINNIKGFELKIKTAQTGHLIGTVQSDLFDITSDYNVFFNLSDIKIKSKINKGQYYRIQIAYIDKQNVVGYYSTLGIVKYTTKPKISIVGLDKNKTNNHQYKYLGLYAQDEKNGDVTERIYSYRFDIYDMNQNIIATSGELIHNYNNDTNIYESQDEWFYENDIDTNVSYYIRYQVKTQNNIILSTPGYRISQRNTINPDLNMKLEAILNYDNGYIDVNLKNASEDIVDINNPVTSSFVVCRASDKENFQDWAEVFRFNLTATPLSRHLWRDYTAEQGHEYIYSIQQYNEYDLYSNRILSNKIYCDFEDAFLFDGKRQLKIKYNPKVSSFKNTIYETKVDTIGGKHPFIFRNNITNYKEFPISGMISYYMDEDELFINSNEYNLDLKTTNLTSSNIAAERNFKLEVLNWLTNGEPKLFRSPAEGNYIIRLMNVSLTPLDQLGRMLHNFNATAYEISDFNFNNLRELNILQTETVDIKNLQWQTFNFFEMMPNGTINYAPHGSKNFLFPAVDEDGKEIEDNSKQLVIFENEKKYLDLNYNLLKITDTFTYTAKTVIFNDMRPGDSVLIVQKGTDMFKPIAQRFTIGATGSYKIDLPIDIIGIYLYDNKNPYGNMVFSHYSEKGNLFNLYQNVEISDTPVRQFIGLQNAKIIDKNLDGYILKADKENILNIIEDIKTEVVYFYQLDFTKRPMSYIYKNGDNFYYSFEDYKNNKILGKFNLTDQILKVDENNEELLDSYYLYKILEISSDNDKIEEEYSFILDGYNKKIYHKDLYDTKIFIDDNTEIDIEETEKFNLSNFGDISSIYIGLGVMLTAMYQLRNYTYNFEIDPNMVFSDKELLAAIQEQYKKLNSLQEKYLNNIKKLENNEIDLENFESIQQDYLKEYYEKYYDYIEKVKKAYKIYKQDNILNYEEEDNK